MSQAYKNRWKIYLGISLGIVGVFLFLDLFVFYIVTVTGDEESFTTSLFTPQERVEGSTLVSEPGGAPALYFRDQSLVQTQTVATLALLALPGLCLCAASPEAQKPSPRQEDDDNIPPPTTAT